MIQKIKQFFCTHHYEIIKEFDDREERSKLINELKNGEGIMFTRPHACKKCGKECDINSDWYF